MKSMYGRRWLVLGLLGFVVAMSVMGLLQKEKKKDDVAEGIDATLQTSRYPCNTKNYKYVYLNSGVNRFYNTDEAKDLVKKMTDLSFNDLNKYNNVCISSPVNVVKRFHNPVVANPPASSSLRSISSPVYLPLDNLKVMDACEFKDKKNPLTPQTVCRENMQSGEPSFSSSIFSSFLKRGKKEDSEGTEKTMENEDGRKEGFTNFTSSDKMYLATSMVLFVGVLFLAARRAQPS
jgi:hypothetical protein